MNIRSPSNEASKHDSYKSILFIILCTIFSSTGQFLFKLSATYYQSIPLIRNIPIIMGFISYGIGMLFLILALKHGDLSFVYPFLSLSFIWVAILAIIVFHEKINVLNWIGITSIMIGVSLTGQGVKSTKK